MALIKDEMLDVREVLAYLGATQDRPHTTRAVIHVSGWFFSPLGLLSQLTPAPLYAACGASCYILNTDYNAARATAPPVAHAAGTSFSAIA